MELLNGLLTEKPNVGEESRCDHMQSDGESSYLNLQVGTLCSIRSHFKSPDLQVMFSEIVFSVMSRFDRSHGQCSCFYSAVNIKSVSIAALHNPTKPTN